jgi:hypothetical protein
MIYKTLHRKLKIEQHVPYLRPGVNIFYYSKRQKDKKQGEIFILLPIFGRSGGDCIVVEFTPNDFNQCL